MDDEVDYIYRASVRTRNGTRIYAHHYGLIAFRIRVRRQKPPTQPKLPGLD